MGYNKGTGAKFKVGGLSIGGTDLNATATELNTAADMSAQGALVRTKVISFTHNAATTEVDTGEDLPSLALLNGPGAVFVEITAGATAGATIDVGLLASSSGGDADGFLDGVGTSSTGIKTYSLTMTASSSGFSSTTAGVFLEKFVADSTGAPGGHAHPIAFATDSVTAKSITYTANSTGTTLAGRIVFIYTEMSS